MMTDLHQTIDRAAGISRQVAGLLDRRLRAVRERHAPRMREAAVRFAATPLRQPHDAWRDTISCAVDRRHAHELLDATEHHVKLDAHQRAVGVELRSLLPLGTRAAKRPAHATSTPTRRGQRGTKEARSNDGRRSAHRKLAIGS